MPGSHRSSFKYPPSTFYMEDPLDPAQVLGYHLDLDVKSCMRHPVYFTTSDDPYDYPYKIYRVV